MSRTVTISADAVEPFLTGVELGKSKRADAKLDQIDSSDDTITLRFETPVVTTTFVEGFFGPSVATLGYDGFKQKYRIEGTKPVRDNVLSMARYIDDQNKK
jgi:hypothetical protein